MHPLILSAFLDELEKIGMARIGFEGGAHVALRLMERAGVPRARMGIVERSIKAALREPGGNKHLGQGEFFLPIGDRGTLVFTPRAEAGHVASTFLGPGMTPKGRHIGQSTLSKDEVDEMKRKLKKALKAAESSRPSRPTGLGGRTVFR